MKEENTIKSYKGFDKDMKCRGFQYEEGREYEMDGKIKVCDKGFHACEQPIDVLKYYSPNNSVYHQVEQSGDIDRSKDDSKIASSKIKIGARLNIRGLVSAQIEYVKAHTKTENTDPEKATAGDRGAATAGNFGAATSRGSASVGENGIASVRCTNPKARGGIGSVLVIVKENDDNFDIAFWKAIRIDGKRYKADTWYTLDDEGKVIKAE